MLLKEALADVRARLEAELEEEQAAHAATQEQVTPMNAPDLSDRPCTGAGGLFRL